MRPSQSSRSCSPGLTRPSRRENSIGAPGAKAQSVSKKTPDELKSRVRPVAPSTSIRQLQWVPECPPLLAVIPHVLPPPPLMQLAERKVHGAGGPGLASGRSAMLSAPC